MSSISRNAIAITPHDSNNLTVTIKKLFVGGAGNIRLLCAGDTSPVTLTGVLAGTIIEDVSIIRIYSTSTTATNMVGFG